MNCPNCQSLCLSEDRYCFHCGTCLETPKPKRGTHLIPLLLLFALSVLGIALFFLIPMGGEVPSDTPWFYMEQGELYFDAALYTGGPELTVPEIVDGEPVTAIGPNCFANCQNLTTVILPDTLYYIGTYAFSGCTSLRGILIPESVEVIDARAFQGCTALEAISLQGTISAIGSDTFDGCEGLKHIFFDGPHSQWEALYSQHINLYTHVYCTDGTFLHR